MKITIPVYVLFLAAALILYPLFIQSNLLDYLGNSAQIIFLFFAAWNLAAARENFRHDEIQRKAWAALSLGMVLWLMGQCLDAFCEIILKEVPYGTISDIFWVLGYIPFIAGLFTLLKNVRGSGISSSNSFTRIVLMLLMLGLYGTIFIFLTIPQLKTPGRPLADKLLDVGYPLLDATLVAFCLLLISESWAFRSGSIGRSWITLCAGFILVAAADIYIGTVSDVESAGYRVLDIVYFSAYFLIALAGLIQIRILRTV